MTANRISEIDALRGIACLMVVYNHFGNYPEIGSTASCMGCIGVDLFFMISGFVISLTIQNNSNWKYFLINRFSRLFPVYWACAILSVLTYVVSYSYINEPAPTPRENHRRGGPRQSDSHLRRGFRHLCSLAPCPRPQNPRR